MRFAFAASLIAIVFIAPARATDDGQWGGQSKAVRDWYRAAELTPAAQARFHFKSCCDHADVVHTKFRVGVAGDDAWEFLEGDAWQGVPPDIIHWDEHAPDGQPTLFRTSTGALTCFYPPESGN